MKLLSEVILRVNIDDDSEKLFLLKYFCFYVAYDIDTVKVNANVFPKLSPLQKRNFLKRALIGSIYWLCCSGSSIWPTCCTLHASRSYERCQTYNQ